MFLDSVSHMDAGSRRRCCGCWCGRDQWLGWDSSRPGVVWVCFWAPGPPPHNVCCGAVRCPSSSAWFPLLVSGEGGGAWWFENWIVDASKGNFGFFLLIAISPNSSIEFGFEIDRFVIILVLRFVVWRSCYQETRGWDNGLAVVPLARAYGGCLGRQYR